MARVRRGEARFQTESGLSLSSSSRCPAAVARLVAGSIVEDDRVTIASATALLEDEFLRNDVEAGDRFWELDFPEAVHVVVVETIFILRREE